MVKWVDVNFTRYKLGAIVYRSVSFAALARQDVLTSIDHERTTQIKDQLTLIITCVELEPHPQKRKLIEIALSRKKVILLIVRIPRPAWRQLSIASCHGWCFTLDGGKKDMNKIQRIGLWETATTAVAHATSRIFLKPDNFSWKREINALICNASLRPRTLPPAPHTSKRLVHTNKRLLQWTCWTSSNSNNKTSSACDCWQRKRTTTPTTTSTTTYRRHR